MKKFKKILLLLGLTILLTNCGKEELELNKEVTLTGTISTSEIITNNETKKVNILNLDEPIIIEGNTIKKIELEYDKGLKDNSEISIKGTLKSNSDSKTDLSYSLDVLDIDDILSYINTFSNEEFSVTIPPEIMKIVAIKKIDNGYIIYNSNDMLDNNEVFRIIAVSNSEFKELTKNESTYIEKAKSDKEKTIVIKYPRNTEYQEEYLKVTQDIISQIDTIKNNVRIK